MKLVSRISGIAASTAMLLLLSAAQADTVYDNFGPGDDFSDFGRIVQGEGVGTIGNVDQGSTFEVGSEAAYLTSVTLGIWATQTGPMDILIADHAVGMGPDNILRTLSVDVTSLGKQTITAFDDGSFELSAGTMYWVVADGRGSFDGSWNFNTTGDMGFTAGRTDGGSWNLRPIDEDRLALRIEGRPVPAPGSLSLVGLAALSVRRRRR